MIVSVQDYRDITKDLSTVDGDVERALKNAQDSAERHTKRAFDEAEGTETLRIYANGRLLPKRYPVTEVTAPTSATPDGDAINIVGHLGWYDTNMLINRTERSAYLEYDTMEVTYTGGYTVETAPYDLKAIICEIAQRNMNPTTLVGVPGGATSLGSGAGSVSGFRLAGFSSLTPALKAALDEFKNRRP